MKITKRTRQVRVSDLHLDQRVQRDLRPAKARKLLANFDPDMLGVLICSMRADGLVYVLDGQHRVWAARESGYTGTLTAVIYEGLNLEQEARMFLGHNDASPVRTLDKLRVKITAADEDAVTIASVLRLHGFTIAHDLDLRRVQAAGSVEKAFRLGGERVLNKTFWTIARAWPADDQAAHGVIILALATFLHRFPDVDTDRLARLLSADRPLTFVSDVKQMKQVERLRSLDEAGARVLVNAWNKGIRGERRLRIVS